MKCSSTWFSHSYYENTDGGKQKAGFRNRGALTPPRRGQFRCLPLTSLNADLITEQRCLVVAKIPFFFSYFNYHCKKNSKELKMNPKDNTWWRGTFWARGRWRRGGGVEGEGEALILNRAKVILLCKFPKTSFAWLIGTGRQTSFSWHSRLGTIQIKDHFYFLATVLMETFSCCLGFRKQGRVVQQHVISLRAVVFNENH